MVRKIFCNKMAGLLLAVGIGTVMTACGQESYEDKPVKAEQEVEMSFREASVHDPSVIKYEGTYYIFGSHLAAAKSTDLMNWEMIGSGVNRGNPIIQNPLEEMKEAFQWARTTTFWAPDVIRLEDGKFYMYYCNCEGSSPLSCIGLAVSDDIEGPYRNQGIFLKSGMTDGMSENGDIYDATVHPNAVDPCVFYDKDGRLWMMYGSYSGGIYILELDKTTGLPVEPGYGKKLLGGNHLRIEASYVQYNPETDYYYMFLSFGGLDSDGGYNIRVCRSKTPDGPYYDSMGNDMIDCKGTENSFFDDKAAQQYGVKLIGNYKWTWHEGESGQNREAYVSPGHNSTVYDEESGKYFIIFHSRFEKSGESHQVRVHQMFFNEDGWPVIAPYRYAGETIGQYEKKDVAGIYKFIKHGRQITTQIKESVDITLYRNGNVEGAYTGAWKLSGDNQIELTLDDGRTYKGVFVKQYDEYGKKYVMGFTALSEDGIAVMGSGLAAID